MTEYTPTAEDIILGKIHLGDNFWRELSEDEVRRGLNEIRAEAWDEGLSAAIDAEIQDGGYGNTQYPDNPYRKGASDE